MRTSDVHNAPREMSTPVAALRAAPSPSLANRDVQLEFKARASAQSTSICGNYGLMNMPRKSSGKQSKVMSRGRTLRVVRAASLPPSPSPCVAAFNEGFPRGPWRISRQNAIFRRMGTRRKSPENASEFGEILARLHNAPETQPRRRSSSHPFRPPRPRARRWASCRMRRRACLTSPREVGNVAGESELVDGGERVLYHNMVGRRTRHEREDTREPVGTAGSKATAKGDGCKGRRTRRETRCNSGEGDVRAKPARTGISGRRQGGPRARVG